MSSSSWMIYGATGYTGELIAREACARGHKPILAGRRREAVEALAGELETTARVFALDDHGAITAALADVDAVLHCAGPFIDTSAPMVAACIEARTHYLDITGEIAVFEACQRRSADAEAASIALIPGVGFDVVPTDCLAAKLAAEVSEPTSLELAFASGAGPSRGTAKTALKGISHGGAIREAGRIKKVPLAWKHKSIPFADKTREAVTIPWGDVSTAFYSTGIGDICVYMAMPPKLIRRLRWLRPLLPLAANKRVQAFLARRIDARVRGPSADDRDNLVSQVWGRVVGRSEVAEGTLSTMESYKLTVLTALEATLRTARGEVAPGTKTPSLAFGADFIDQFDRTSVTIETRALAS